MNNTAFDFGTWLAELQLTVYEKVGVDVKSDMDIVDDYNRGRDVYVVSNEIAAEHIRECRRLGPNVQANRPIAVGWYLG